MIRATAIVADGPEPADTVTLAYDDRHRRRIAMTGDGGLAFLLDLPDAIALKHGDRLALEDGRTVEVRAAPEHLIEVHTTSPEHLVRTAWHVGNRHLACEVHADRLVLRYDHVIEHMLIDQGCTVTRITAPFQPESGAYGHSHGTDAAGPDAHAGDHAHHRHHPQEIGDV